MLRRMMTLLLLCAGLAPAAVAGELRDFEQGMAPVLGNLRTATNYLRTGNLALADMELGEAKVAFGKVQSQFRGHDVEPYAAAALQAFMTNAYDHLARAEVAMAAGDAAASAAQLASLRLQYADLRRHAGLYDLADCVLELGPSMENLRKQAGLFADDGSRAAPDLVVATAAAFHDRLARCDNWAPAAVAIQPEFRRLMDGALGSSIEIGRAAAKGDRGQVHRYLIELQSFQRLLDFRFG